MRPDCLNSILERLSGTLDFTGLLRQLADALVCHARVAACQVWIRRSGDACDFCAAADQCQERSECLHLLVNAGAMPEDEQPARCPIGIGSTGLVARTGATLVVDNPGQDNRFTNDSWLIRNGIQACAVLPLSWDTRTMGVIGIYCRDRLSDADHQQLAGFIRRASFFVANAHAADLLRRRTEHLQEEVAALRAEILAGQQVEQLIGNSAPARRLRDDIQAAAGCPQAVLIQGPPGVGKELVARSVHARSPRASEPFLKLDCHCASAAAAECILFGNEGEAYACPGRSGSGWLELAHCGTIFLRHVERLPLPLQVRLREYLKLGRYSRAGGTELHASNTRILASTTTDIAAAARAGSFDPGLYELLSRQVLKIPALAERAEDIPLLVNHWLERFSREYFKPVAQVDPQTVRKLAQYSWPGNDRELSQVLERAVLLGTAPCVDLEAEFPTCGASAEPTLREIERAHIIRALRRSRGVIQGRGGAAALLGLRPSTLRSRMGKLGIPRHP